MDTVRRSAADRVIDLTDGYPPGTTTPTGPAYSPAGGGLAALAAFENAANVSMGYRKWLADHGVNPADVTAIDEVPYLTKRDVFGTDLEPWLDGGDVTAAAELLTSSGHSGAFSVGVTSRPEAERLGARVDAVLEAFGAGPARSTLLLNCLPTGISVPTAVATIATPGTRVEMALELFERFHTAYDLVVVVAEPVFCKEFAERLHAAYGSAGTAGNLACVVGGEWVSESWRTYVSGLFGLSSPQHQGDMGVLVSMGAAELGLHLLFETPALRAVRSALHTTGHTADLFGEGWGYTPALFTFDQAQVHVEQRHHRDGASTLAFTTLTRRLLPLVRYDIGDLGAVIPATQFNGALDEMEMTQRVDGPVVVFWGRRSSGAAIGGRAVRPELVKERLFSSPTESAVLTGRFYIEPATEPILHLQLRRGTSATPHLGRGLAAFLSDVTATRCRTDVHAYDAYPFHPSDDHEHKPVYDAAVSA